LRVPLDALDAARLLKPGSSCYTNDPMSESANDALTQIDAGIDAAFAAARDDNELRNVYARYLGREGSVTLIMKRMGELAPAERKPFGQRANAVRQHAETAREGAERRLREEARRRELEAPLLDVTLPGRRPRLGRIHPLARVMHDIVDVFVGLGFDIAEGPEVESTANNFDRLGYQPDHPAIDMQDTFFVDSARPEKRPLLRSHTSTVQIREMLSHPPPVMVVAPGVVYRRDDDVTHSPQFLQLEGLMVDRGVSLGHLKAVLETSVKRLFGASVPTRFRCSYFPFVEPGAELDMGCQICAGKDPSCRVCKGSGWIEVLGCGMVHPVVFENVGYDPEQYTGFAFGMGIDRIAMNRFRVPDIRLLYENDVRFLESL
jgi:phenylalanyl-tRNA synthetase alpha chain